MIKNDYLKWLKWLKPLVDMVIPSSNFKKLIVNYHITVLGILIKKFIFFGLNYG
jgi:hypothetical protein